MTQLRYVAGLLIAVLGFGIAGCGGGGTINAQSRYPQQAPYGQQQRQQGMSTRNKVLLLAGAAAVYYLYQKHKNRQGQGPEGQYFRSRNGRVYYRDMKTGEYRWVDPPTQPIQVPADEYERYTGRNAPATEGVIRNAPAGW
jgi:hypothetical protein